MSLGISPDELKQTSRHLAIAGLEYLYSARVLPDLEDSQSSAESIRIVRQTILIFTSICGTRAAESADPSISQYPQPDGKLSGCDDTSSSLIDSVNCVHEQLVLVE